MAIFHPSLTTLTIFTVSITIITGTIQSRRSLQSSTTPPPADIPPAHDHPSISDVEVEVAADLSNGTRGLFNGEFDNFFELLLNTTADTLPDDVIEFYNETNNSAFPFLFVFTQGFEAIVDAECDRDQIDFDQLVQDIVADLTSAARNDQCSEINLFNFDEPGLFFFPFFFGGCCLPRRRLLSSSSDPLSSSDDTRDGMAFGRLRAFINATFEGLEEAFTDAELDQLDEELFFLQFLFVLIEAAEAVIEDDCDLSDLDIVGTTQDIEGLLRDFLALVNGDTVTVDDDNESNESEESSDDFVDVDDLETTPQPVPQPDNLDVIPQVDTEDDNEGNESEESSDDFDDESDDNTPAPTVGVDEVRRNDERVRNDVDLDQFVKDQGLESVDRADIDDMDDGTKVITLRLAQSTLVNVWSLLVVVCCFNVSMAWFCLCRGDKKDIVYVPDEERGGSLADPQSV